MISTRRRLARRRTGRPDGRDLLVIDVNEDVCSVWSSDTGIVAEPSRVAIDGAGKVRGFGLGADLLTESSGGQPRAVSLFDLDPSQSLEAEFLTWLLERSGVGPIRGTSVFVPLEPGAAPERSNPWRRAIEEMGGDVLVIHRPLAAAVALGLDVDECSCHLTIEVFDTHIELAFIRAGSVAGSKRIARTDHAATSEFVEETLESLDPDEELEIRDRGVTIYGWSALRHVSETISAVGLPLARPIGRGPTVLNGTRAMAEEILPWLAFRQ